MKAEMYVGCFRLSYWEILLNKDSIFTYLAAMGLSCSTQNLWL